jgi:hypothetical protein
MERQEHGRQLRPFRLLDGNRRHVLAAESIRDEGGRRFCRSRMTGSPSAFGAMLGARSQRCTLLNARPVLADAWRRHSTDSKGGGRVVNVAPVQRGNNCYYLLHFGRAVSLRGAGK